MRLFVLDGQIVLIRSQRFVQVQSPFSTALVQIQSIDLEFSLETHVGGRECSSLVLLLFTSRLSAFM